MDIAFKRAAAALAAAALTACASGPAIEQGTVALSADPSGVHARLITLDTHVDIETDLATAANDPGGFTTNQVDLPKMRAGGLDAAFFILYSAYGPLTGEGYAVARRTVETKHAAIVRMTRAYPDQIALATTAAEARRAVREGKLVAFIGMENAYPLGESVADVELWAARGVTYVGPVHFGHNQFGDSANGPTGGTAEPGLYEGLSPLGEELVAALNRVGVMVDVSHAARSTMMDIAAISRAPIIASHSGVAAVNTHVRNLDDEQLRVIAATGGVAQIVALSSYVKTDPPERAAAIEALRARMGLATAEARAAMDRPTRLAYEAAVAEIDRGFDRATVSDFVDHIEHAVAVAGIDHVGIASDFDGGGGVRGWMNAAETGAVTAELLARGYSAADLDKIWSGNLLRVLDDVQAIGRALRAAEWTPPHVD
jgi:membrane dipeptidase